MHKGRCVKLLCILSGCPIGARKGHISIFAMRLHSKKGRLQPSFQLVEKVRLELGFF